MKSIYSNFSVKALAKIAIYRCVYSIYLTLLCFSSPFLNIATASAQEANNPNLPQQTVISSAVSNLIAVLRSENVEARVNAARALGGMGIQAKIAEPALKVALYDKEPRVRYSAATALANLGGDTKAAFPHLLKALESESKWIRNDAAYALSNVALNLLKEASELSQKELNQAITDFEKISATMEKSKFEIPQAIVTSVNNSLDYLKMESGVDSKQNKPGFICSKEYFGAIQFR